MEKRNLVEKARIMLCILSNFALAGEIIIGRYYCVYLVLQKIVKKGHGRFKCRELNELNKDENDTVIEMPGKIR